MGLWRNHVLKYKIFSWVLIFSLVLHFLIQLEIHVHHDDFLNDDEHLIDYHPITEQYGFDHHSEGDETHELKSTPDFIIKKSLDRDFGFLQIVLFIIFISVPAISLKHQWFAQGYQRVRDLYHGLSPPTRGPPVISF